MFQCRTPCSQGSVTSARANARRLLCNVDSSRPPIGDCEVLCLYHNRRLLRCHAVQARCAHRTDMHPQAVGCRQDAPSAHSVHMTLHLAHLADRDPQGGRQLRLHSCCELSLRSCIAEQRDTVHAESQREVLELCGLPTARKQDDAAQCRCASLLCPCLWDTYWQSRLLGGSWSCSWSWPWSYDNAWSGR